MKSNKSPKTKSRVKEKLAYACGDIYGGSSFLIFSLLYMNFLILVEGMPVVYASIIIFIGKIWDAVTDPVVGRISDKTRSRYGRRRLYFLIGIVPVFLSFVMLFYSFGIMDITAKFVYHTFAYMFFGTAFTIVMIPYNAILSDITSDYNERTSFTTVRMLFSGGSSLLAAVIPGILIKVFGGAANGPEQKPGYLIMALIFAAIYALCWVITFKGTKEREDLPEPDTITLKDWLSVFKNKAYTKFLGIFLSFQIGVDLVLALFIFYIDIVVLQYKNYELVIGLILVFQVVFMGLMGALATRRGKAFPLLVGLPLWIFAMLCFIPLNIETPIIVFCILSILIGAGAASGNLATWAMLADMFDVDEIITGKRREGIYSGITTFLRKFASGVAVLILGFGLKAIGFDQDQYSLLRATAEAFNPASYAQSGVVMGIKWMFILIPIILLGISFIFALKNRIDKRRFDAILHGIELFKTDGNLDKLPAAELEDILYATESDIESLWNVRQD